MARVRTFEAEIRLAPRLHLLKYHETAANCNHGSQSCENLNYHSTSAIKFKSMISDSREKYFKLDDFNETLLEDILHLMLYKLLGCLQILVKAQRCIE
jgi:hypothetical protein